MLKMPKKNIVILVLISILVICSVHIGRRWYYHWCHTAGNVGLTAGDVGDILAGYIAKNKGQFPRTESDLLREGYLKKVHTEAGFGYFLKLVVCNS